MLSKRSWDVISSTFFHLRCLFPNHNNSSLSIQTNCVLKLIKPYGFGVKLLQSDHYQGFWPKTEVKLYFMNLYPPSLIALCWPDNIQIVRIVSILFRQFPDYLKWPRWGRKWRILHLPGPLEPLTLANSVDRLTCFCPPWPSSTFPFPSQAVLGLDLFCDHLKISHFTTYKAYRWVVS